MSYSDYTKYALDPTGKPRFFGVYRGIVKNTNDPKKGNRLQVAVPQITGSDSLDWAEPCLPPFNGTIVLPLVGDTVWISFESGDTSYPVWTGILTTSVAATRAYYGAFSSYVTQTGSTTAPTAMAFEQTDENYGISMANDLASKKTRITFANAGTYNIQFSAQFHNTNTSDQDVYIWLRKNGSSAAPTTGNVVGSTGVVSVPSSHGGTPGHVITGWNFVFTVAANDYYEFLWSTSSTAVVIQYYSVADNGSPTKPSTASLVLTVTPI